MPRRIIEYDGIIVLLLLLCVISHRGNHQDYCKLQIGFVLMKARAATRAIVRGVAEALNK